jgi:hypothetical protein
MPMPFYSLTEHCDLARQEMRAFLAEQVQIEQTADHFLTRVQAHSALLVLRHLPLTPQDFAAVMLMQSYRPLPYAVATGDTLGDVIKRYARFHLRAACRNAEEDWAEGSGVHAELADLGRVV